MNEYLLAFHKDQDADSRAHGLAMICRALEHYSPWARKEIRLEEDMVVLATTANTETVSRVLITAMGYGDISSYVNLKGN
jgi:hypothetical protein